MFVSQVLLNLIFFALLVCASLMLDTAQFAKLSLSLSWVNVLSIVFSFGLDQAALKLGFERREPGFIAVNVLVKGLLFGITASAMLLASVVFHVDLDIAVAAVAAAGVAFWSATRSVEQFRKRFHRLASLNCILTATRAVFGGLALFSHQPAFILAAVHLAAQLPIHLFTLTKTLNELKGDMRMCLLVPMLKVAPIIFVSGLLFNSLGVTVQQSLYHRGDLAGASAFGVVQLFIAPISILLATLRMYFLPRLLDPDNSSNFKKSELMPLLLLWILLGIGAACVIGVIIPLVYSTRLPLAEPFAMSYLSTYVIVAGLGVLNLKSQRGNLIVADLVTNALRFTATWILCVLVQDARTLVSVAALVMLAGELSLHLFLCFNQRTTLKSRMAIAPDQ